MNYLPYAGYWFYGGVSATETASFTCSWGLLSIAGSPVSVVAYFIPTIPYIPTMPTIGRVLILAGLIVMNWRF